MASGWKSPTTPDPGDRGDGSGVDSATSDVFGVEAGADGDASPRRSMGGWFVRNAPAAAAIARVSPSRSAAASSSTIGRLSVRPRTAAAVTRRRVLSETSTTGSRAIRRRCSRYAAARSAQTGHSARAALSSAAVSGVNSKSRAAEASGSASCSWITSRPPRVPGRSGASRVPGTSSFVSRPRSSQAHRRSRGR